jgi:hypothetical protein
MSSPAADGPQRRPRPVTGALRWLWLGAALATMFFYPLASELVDGPFYLQWQRRNTLELVLAHLVLSVLLGVLLRAADAVRQARLRLVGLLAVSAIPFASFLVFVALQLGLRDRLDSTALRLPPASGAVLAGAAALAGVGAVALAPLRARRVLLGAIAVLSPLTVVVWVNLLRHGLHDVVVEIGPGAPPAVSARLPDVFVFVFDELDPRFLYEGREIRSRYPRLRSFGASADHYHAAVSPGTETLTSMMGLLRGRPIGAVDDSQGSRLTDGRGAVIRMGEDNVFARARRRGYWTVVYGWLHPYCELLQGSLDQCRSFSIANYGGVEESFSLLSPVFSDLIVLPAQPPFALLRNPVCSRFQRRLVGRTYESTVAAFDVGTPLFVLVHFSIPHLPFVFDGERYAPPADPFLQDVTNYERQLGHVDYLFGRLLDELARRNRLDGSYVAVLSDHGYRAIHPGRRARRVPLIVKRPFQRTRVDVDARFPTEHVLSLLLDAAAPEAPSSP